MAIYKNGDKFMASFGAGENRKRSNHSTEEAAQAWLTEQEARRSSEVALKAAAAPVSNVWTLQKAFDHTLKHHWTAGGGVRKSIVNANFALHFFGEDTLIDKIDSKAVLSYMEWLMEEHENSPATLNKKLSNLSVILTNALDIGGIENLPRLKRYTEATKTPHWFTDSDEVEMLRIAEKFGYPELRDFIILGFDTGMRRMEMLGLAMADLHNGNLLLHADQTKSKKARAVRSTPRVKALFEARPAGQRMLFKELTESVLRKQWTELREAMKRSDDPFFIPHTMRHTCATRMISGGARMKAVQAWLGHGVMQSTMVYSHLEPGQMDGCLEALVNRQVGA
jgi:integrase